MQTELISHAVDFLEQGCPGQAEALRPEALSLLVDTGHVKTSDDGIEFSEHRATRAKLLKLLSEFERFFPLPAPSAPGLFAFGGEVGLQSVGLSKVDGRLSSVSGASTTPGRGINSCLGEAAERLSQYRGTPSVVGEEGGERPKITTRTDQTCLKGADWMPGKHCASEERVSLLKRDCVFVSEGATPSSTGCGAGLTLDAAVLHGLLELVERDAYASWWIAGRPGRPIDLASKALVTANACLRALRGHASDRRTWLLDISGDLGLPCIAAVSSNEDGLEIAVGTACHPQPEQAVERALTEMCLMEMSHQVAKMKAERSGEETLNSKDEMHLKRARELDAKTCQLLHPQGVPAIYAAGLNESDLMASSKALAEHLRALGIEAYYADLTSPDLGVPVAKCISPDLQAYPYSEISPRLERQIETFGGGGALSTGIMLY